MLCRSALLSDVAARAAAVLCSKISSGTVQRTSYWCALRVRAALKNYDGS